MKSESEMIDETENKDLYIERTVTFRSSKNPRNSVKNIPAIVLSALLWIWYFPFFSLNYFIHYIGTEDFGTDVLRYPFSYFLEYYWRLSNKGYTVPLSYYFAGFISGALSFLFFVLATIVLIKELSKK
jgi:hypothetical protein